MKHSIVSSRKLVIKKILKEFAKLFLVSKLGNYFMMKNLKF